MPILMTTLIAILPLVVGIGEGVIMASEMTVVVVGGLLSSTLQTSLAVTVIYHSSTAVASEHQKRRNERHSVKEKYVTRFTG